MSSKIAIYTSIFGNYDNLTEPAVQPENCDFICFTDADIHSDVWKIIKVTPIYSDSNRNAKKYKVLPHRFLKEYDYSIWIDGNMLLLSDPTSLIESILDNCNVAFFNHANNLLDSRNCLYDEAEHIISIGNKNYQLNPERGKLAYKDNPATIKRQIEKYQHSGYPTKNGLITGMVIVRRHCAADCIQTMEDWWTEIQYNSKRDQLSFNYCAWKNNLKFNYILGDSRDNTYFKNMGKHTGKK
jgi:hypothetical protein